MSTRVSTADSGADTNLQLINEIGEAESRLSKTINCLAR
jgi:hypothetical protein